jgi:hypothetical protein
MMVNGLYERCSLGLLKVISLPMAFFISTSCATAHIPNASLSPILEKKTELVDPRGELSSKEVVAGTLVLVKVNVPTRFQNNSITGEFEGIKFPFYPSDSKDEAGVFESLLGVPYLRKPGPGVIQVRMGEGSETASLELPVNVIDGDYPSEVLHVNGRRVNPTNKQDLARIIREQAEVGLIYKKVTPQKYWKGAFALPIESKVTSPFGSRRIYNGQLKNFHPGLDLKAAIGTPILSAAPGVVVLAKNLFYTGNTVMIDHGYGVITLYAHMSKIKVKPGDLVNNHELLGLSGKTGRVNGPHLHWQAVVHQVKVNPQGLLLVAR